MIKAVKRKRVSGKDHNLLFLSSAQKKWHWKWQIQSLEDAWKMHVRRFSDEPRIIFVVHPTQEFMNAALRDFVLLATPALTKSVWKKNSPQKPKLEKYEILLYWNYIYILYIYTFIFIFYINWNTKEGQEKGQGRPFLPRIELAWPRKMLLRLRWFLCAHLWC